MAAAVSAQGEGRWRVSSYSASSASCVEVAGLGRQVGMRDSKDPDGPVLCFTRAQWRTFIDAVKRGDLDR
jgi:hypothetical protein